MTQDMGINPLMDFARKTECSVKLPSQGLWYDDDNIGFNAIGEVDIRPMLPNDEMLIVNPDSLISGDAIISLIRSCCPTIKRPEELYYPDVNVLLLGIRKATYGDELLQESVCPKCWEKKNQIEIENKDKTKEEIDKLITEKEKNNELMVIPQQYKYSIQQILGGITLLPKESFITTKEGLKIYVAPYKCMDKIKFSVRNIQQQKIYDYYKKITNENREKDIDEYIDNVDKMSKMYIDLTSQTVDIVASAILKICLPNGEIITNKQYIDEFIRNINADLVKQLYSKIDELNMCGLQSTLDYECECCGHKWKEKFYGFNQSDFFGISS